MLHLRISDLEEACSVIESAHCDIFDVARQTFLEIPKPARCPPIREPTAPWTNDGMRG